MNKKWELNEANDALINKISEEFNVSKLVANIIANKGLTNSDEIEVFLHPRRTDFHDPFMMPDMEKAVDRVVKAIETHEKVAIYGDYDVDGITSSTVLKRFLAERGLETDVYIPNRLHEGYGLNENAIREIADTKHTLIITVDCGITGNKEIELAKSFGIDTVVTDHHEPTETLPDAVAVVDCKRKDNKYPFNGLAGVGVAFKLTQAISMRLGVREEEYLKYLDLVCVGTISDIVPLVDENRTISKLGLKLVRQTRNIGLKVLLDSIGYKKIDSMAISFGVAPRINACGRMGHEKEALELFLTDSKDEAERITHNLNEYNQERQEIEKRIFNEAQKMMEDPEQQKLPCIVLGGENWHHGVIGIVSSKITEMYFKPSVLLCYEDDLARGSGRSIPGFDLHEALMKCQDTIERFGGHSMAIGITIKKDKFKEFSDEFEKIAKSAKIDEIVPIINVDAKINLNEINREIIESLKLLEPFGEGNKMPIFAFKNLKIDSIRALSEGKHIKMTLKDGNSIINAIGFNLGYLSNEYRIGDKIDVVGTLEINSFNGVDNLQINLKDVMKSI